MLIVGAGLSGLIAAHAFPRAQIIEASSTPAMNHAALLRFRSDVVANLVGIEFRRVQVNKGIWFDGRFRDADIRLANLYSQKVVGKLSDRSIWNIDPVERFIAPENLYQQLVDAVGSRISWGIKVGCFNDIRHAGEPIVSTMPMPMALAAARMAAPDLEFNRSPIVVSRYKIANSDVFQSIYFPSPATKIYRASVTGDLLIVEAVAAGNPDEWMDGLDQVLEAFGNIKILSSLGEVTQRYGKISPINDSVRKALMFTLTHEHDVYSLGRFAIWKNILLDDVVHDLAVVRRLMRSSSYEVRKAVE